MRSKGLILILEHTLTLYIQTLYFVRFLSFLLEKNAPKFFQKHAKIVRQNENVTKRGLQEFESYKSDLPRTCNQIQRVLEE